MNDDVQQTIEWERRTTNPIALDLQLQQTDDKMLLLTIGSVFALENIRFPVSIFRIHVNEQNILKPIRKANDMIKTLI